jgi:hypothetical protein
METRDVLARPNCLLRGRLAPLGPQYGGSLAHLAYIDGLGDNRELRVSGRWPRCSISFFSEGDVALEYHV